MSGGLADHEQADLVELFESAFLVNVHVETGNAFQLVERAASDAKTAAGNHRHPDLVAREQGREHERNFIAHATRRMFVDFRRRILRILEHATAVHHRFGQMLRLGHGHAAKEHGHGPGAHLVIGNLLARKCVDQILDLGRTQLLAVTFFFDERRDVHLHGENSSRRRA